MIRKIVPVVSLLLLLLSAAGCVTLSDNSGLPAVPLPTVVPSHPVPGMDYIFLENFTGNLTQINEKTGWNFTAAEIAAAAGKLEERYAEEYDAASGIYRIPGMSAYMSQIVYAFPLSEAQERKLIEYLMPELIADPVRPDPRYLLPEVLQTFGDPGITFPETDRQTIAAWITSIHDNPRTLPFRELIAEVSGAGGYLSGWYYTSEDGCLEVYCSHESLPTQEEMTTFAGLWTETLKDAGLPAVPVRFLDIHMPKDLTAGCPVFIDVVSPAEGAALFIDVVPVSLSVRANILSPNGIASAQIASTGYGAYPDYEISIQTRDIENMAGYTYPVPVLEGPLTYTVTATDLKGNTVVLPVNITLNIGLPPPPADVHR